MTDTEKLIADLIEKVNSFNWNNDRISLSHAEKLLSESIRVIKALQFTIESQQKEIDALLKASEWQPIATIPPQTAVLIHYKNRLGNSRIVKAKFIPQYTEETNGDTDGDDVGEYDEPNDRYTYVEGFWEMIDNWDDYSFVFISEHKPDAWMPLPRTKESES